MSRRSLLTVLTAISLIAVPLVAHAGPTKRPLVTEFDATAYPGLLACSMESGQYVTAAHRSFTAPGKGRLFIELGDYAGPTGTADWDLYLRDKAGEILVYDFSTAPESAIDYRVKKAETFDIMMCNFSSPDTVAHGKITFTPS